MTTVIDLTHPLGADVPTFPGDPGLRVREIGDREGGWMREVVLGEHLGTHADAPAHFAPGQATIDQVLASSLVAPAVVVDVRAAVANDADYRIRAADVEAWESVHGAVPEGALIVGVTGWSDRWNDPARYRNADTRGVLHFPGFGEDAVDWLLARRPRVVGLAIDTLSVDYGPSTRFEVHRQSHAAGFYHVENVDRPERLPAKGAMIVVGVLPLVGGSGSPARVIALVP
jgi:kynurenine formamidase